MSTLVTYKEIDGGDVQEVSPDPVSLALGGLALNTNFRAIADSLPRNNYGASTNPTPDNDSVDTAGIGVDFSKGSRWYNGTAIFECVDPTPTAAVWVNPGGPIPTLEEVTTAGATTDQLVTLSGGLLGILAGQSYGFDTRSIAQVECASTNTNPGPYYDSQWCLYTSNQAGGDVTNVIASSGRTTVYWGQNSTYHYYLATDWFNYWLAYTGSAWNFFGNELNLNNGSGTGGSTLNLDGGQIATARP